MVDLLGIVGSVTTPSRTRTATEVSLAAAEAKSDATTDVLHLADYDLVPADGRTLDEYTGDTKRALELITDSDAVIISTPVYRAAYSGVLKNLFDLIPRGTWQADVAPLENTAIGLIATGANDSHYLAIDQELRPIVGFFGGYTVGSVYAHAEHFTDHNDAYRVTDDAIRERLETLGCATNELADAIATSDYLSAMGPQI